MGDREAFSPIVEGYGNVVMGTIYLMMRDRAVSEKPEQETFVRAWKGIATFRLGQPLKPWLVRVAVNQALNAKARRLVQVEPLSEANEGGGADPWFGRPDSRNEVQRALSQVSADHRRVVVPRYFAEISTREVANTLGVRVWYNGECLTA